MRIFTMLAIGFAVLGLMRRQSAAVRHWALLVAVLCSAGVPLLQVVVPSWRLPARSAAAIIAPEPVAVTSFEVATPSSNQATSDTGPLAIADASLVARLLPWIARVQWAGAGLGLLVLVVGLTRLKWIAWHSSPVRPGRLDRIWTGLIDELGISRPVRLHQTDQPPLLMTWGARRPIVILPRAADQWSDARLRAVLCHELAHVRRGDWLALMVVELLRAFNWYNPLTWLAARRLRFESELACDDVVLAAGVRAPDYAGHLLAVVRLTRVHQGRPALASAMARPGGIERRVEAMLNVGLPRVPVSRSLRLLITALLLTAAVFVAGYGASAQSLASFSGVVFDPQNLGVPRATVSLTDPVTEARHEVRSDATGRFEFVGLKPGDYRLEARVMGFSPVSRSVSIIGRHVDQDLTLSLGSLSETVTLSYGPDTEAAPKAAALVRSAGAPKQAACELSTAGGNIRPPMKVRDVKPVYPTAGDTPEEGVVVVDARIGTEGSVVSATPREPVSASLAEAAVAAVNEWRFTPTLLNCRPVEVAMTVSVRFERR